MEANVNAMEATIAYTINWDNVDTAHYEIEALTVATHLDGTTSTLDNYFAEHPSHKCVINRIEGIAGHTVVHFRDRGKILTSSSHWIELDKFSIDEHKVFEGFREMGGEVFGK